MTEKEQLILSLLTEKPMAMQEITKQTGINARWLREIIGCMRSDKLIRVQSWERACGPYRPVFAVGCAPDTAKPDAETRVIICRQNPAEFKRTEMDEWLFRVKRSRLSHQEDLKIRERHKNDSGIDCHPDSFVGMGNTCRCALIPKIQERE